MALLRHSVYVAALLALCSCGLSRREPGADGFGALSENDREEYERIARLEEHPLDPMKASRGDLLLIPDFPKRLAERIVELRSGTRSLSTLIGRLSPPERAALYRFESYLLLPGSRPVRWETRLTFVEREGERERLWDLRTDLRSQRSRVLARFRPEGAHRFYLSGGCCRGHLRLHAGDFTPDLAWGLVSSYYHTSYQFSSGYYLRRCRWISGTSSFFGPSIRGGAVEAWTGWLRLLLFRGNECIYYNGRLSTRGDLLSGMRLGAGSEKARAGLSICAGPKLPGGRAVSLDFGLDGGAAEIQCELALFARDGAEGVCALGIRGGKNDLRLLFRGNGLSSSSRFGRSFHGRSGPKRGISAVARRRLAGRVELLSAIERWSSWDGKREKGGDMIRFELRRRGKVSETKLSYSWRRDNSCVLMPYPPHEETAVELRSSANLLQSLRLSRRTRLRISIRMPLGDERGILVAPSILLDRPVRAAISFAWRHSYCGTPLYYLYEPTVRGFYPWRSLQGDGWRISALCEISASIMRLSTGLFCDGSGEREGVLQMSMIF